MNPKITITVDSTKAKAVLEGMVTVGAKVDVVVNGLSASDIPDWGEDDDFTGSSLRFRVVDEIGKDLVRFPLNEKTDESTGDVWSVSGDVFTATDVDFNTDALRKWFYGIPFNEHIELGVILDSIVDAAQYATGKVKVKQWSAASTEDPTVLPDWRETLAELEADLASVEASKTAAEAAATSAGESATAASASASAASTSASSALESATAASASASAASTSASSALECRDAAAGSATDASVSADDAEASKDAAIEAKDAAETAASHYPYIGGDGYWYVWDVDSGMFVKNVKAQGVDGKAATIEVGTVTTGDAGTSAEIVNVGTSSAAKFNFTIPRGEKGGGDMYHSEFSEVEEITGRYKMSDIKDKLNSIINLLKGSAALVGFALCALVSGAALADITPQTATLGSLYNDDLVVTNVTGAATDPGVVSNIVEGYGYALPSVTNGFVRADITNGLATASITNGLASQTFVTTRGYVTESITNGLVTAAITNGLATTAYVDTAVASATPGDYLAVSNKAYAAATPLAVTNIVDGMADYAVKSSVTNAVATAMTDMLGENWKTTYGGGLAGILAAIFAAIAWLKSNKLTKGLGTDGVPTDENVVTLFSTGNTELTNTIEETVPATALKETDDDGEYELDPEAANPWDEKASTISCGSGDEKQVVDVVDGDANITELFSSENTSLKTAEHYDLVENAVDSDSQIVMLDQTSQYVTLNAAFTLKVPTATVSEGTTMKARDMVVYVANEATSAVNCTLDTSVEWHYDGSDSGIISIPAGFNALYISEAGVTSDSKRIFVAKLWTPAKSVAAAS